MNLLNNYKRLEESINVDKLKQENKSLYLEFILSLFLIKKVEQQSIKGISTITNTLINSNNGLDIDLIQTQESIYDAINFRGLPKEQKIKILFYSLSKLIFDDDIKKAQAIYVIFHQILSLFLAQNDFKDLSNFLIKLQKFNIKVNSAPKNESNDDETDVDIVKQAKTAILFQTILIPLLLTYERYLSKTLASNDIEIETSNKTPKVTVFEFKKLLGTFWMLLKNVNPIIQTEPLFADLLIDFIEHMWSCKYLISLQGIFYYIIHIFKDHYRLENDEIDLLSYDLSIKIVFIN